MLKYRVYSTEIYCVEADHRNQDLEEMIKTLEEERSRLTSQVIKSQEKLSSLEVTSATAENRLVHRSSQVGELQNELAEREAQVEKLEKEVTINKTKRLIFCFSGTFVTFNPLHHKCYYISSICIKNCLHILNCQFNLAFICHHFVLIWLLCIQKE